MNSLTQDEFYSFYKLTMLDPSAFEEIFIHFSTSIFGLDKENEILWDITKNCISKLGFVDCVIYTLDENRGALVQKAAHGQKSIKNNSIYSPIEIALGQGITGNVALSGKAEVIHDTTKDHRYIVDDENRLSEITVPIIIDKKVYGIIDCEHPIKSFFTQEHLRLLKGIASLCAIKIKNLRADKLLQIKRRELLTLKQEMVDLKVRAFSSQMNPHFLFNSLNAIQYFIISGHRVKALDFLSTFSNIIRFHISNLNKDSVFLLDEIAMLNQYLKLQKFRYNNKLHFKINNSGGIEKKIAIIPSFVLLPFFETIIESTQYTNKNEHCKIKAIFNIGKSYVQLKVFYTNGKSKENQNTSPELEKRMKVFQNQIDFLDRQKKYDGKMKMTINLSDDKHIQNNFALTLPNLI